MDSFTAIPDYAKYLAYIFAQSPDQPENVRWRAGLTLKNNIRTSLKGFSPDVVLYVKAVIFSRRPGQSKVPFVWLNRSAPQTRSVTRHISYARLQRL